MFEWTRERLLLRIHTVTNRPALHDDDRMMPVFALRRGGQADDVERFHLPENLLEADG